MPAAHGAPTEAPHDLNQEVSRIMRKLIPALLFTLSALLCVSPAFAQVSLNGGTRTLSPGDTAQAGAAATATGGSVGNISNTANGGTHIQTTTVTPIQTNTQLNTQVTTQGQQQGQAQGQRQGQAQGQKQQANNEGNHQTVEGTTFDRYAPSVAAPGLTAAGTGVCLGSVSLGLTGPMAGIMGGFTKVDQGCEDRSNAALLFQFGQATGRKDLVDAAVKILMNNERVRTAMAPDPIKSASLEAAGVSAALSPELSIPAAMARTQSARVEAVQGQ